MTISADETLAASCRAMREPIRGGTCEIAANTKSFGRGWFSRVTWSADTKYFVGFDREDALRQARRFAAEWCLTVRELGADDGLGSRGDNGQAA